MTGPFGYHRGSIDQQEDDAEKCQAADGCALSQYCSCNIAGAGNVLWDCINVLTSEAVKEVCRRGGVQAIAISHPHFYTGMAAWAQQFDVPIFIHAKDRQWVTEPCSSIQYWEGVKPSFIEPMLLMGDIPIALCIPAACLRCAACKFRDISGPPY